MPIIYDYEIARLIATGCPGYFFVTGKEQVTHKTKRAATQN